MANRIHISEEDAIRDPAKLLELVRAGSELSIECDGEPIAIMRGPWGRKLSECLARLPKDYSAVMDEDFANDIEAGIASRRTPLNPPGSD